MAPLHCVAVASVLVFFQLCSPCAAQAHGPAAVSLAENAAANPMHMGCEVLHQAEQAGQFVDEQEQQWYDYAKKLCHSNGWAPGKVQTTPGDVLDALKQKAAE